MKVGPSGHAKLEARLVRKYGGLKWLDPDKDEEGNTYTSRTAHPDMMFFHKQHRHNQYSTAKRHPKKRSQAAKKKRRPVLEVGVPVPTRVKKRWMTATIRELSQHSNGRERASPTVS